MNKTVTKYYFLLLITFLLKITTPITFAQDTKIDSIKKENQFSFAGIILPSKSPESGFYLNCGISAYINNVFYNLISNSIKYKKSISIYYYNTKL